jgi:hypothetical protein
MYTKGVCIIAHKHHGSKINGFLKISIRNAIQRIIERSAQHSSLQGSKRAPSLPRSLPRLARSYCGASITRNLQRPAQIVRGTSMLDAEPPALPPLHGKSPNRHPDYSSIPYLHSIWISHRIHGDSPPRQQPLLFRVREFSMRNSIALTTRTLRHCNLLSLFAPSNETLLA